jgi:hypothetical protein
MAVPALIIAFSIFVSSRNIISEQMRELAQKNLQSTRLIIQYRLFLAAEMTTLIYTNPAILGILTSPVSDDPAENLIRSRTMDRALNSYVMSNYFSADVFPILPRLYLKNRPELVTHSPYSQIYDLNQVEREYWYHSGTADINLFITIDTQNRRLILGRKLYDIGNVDLPVYTALLTMEMSTSYFNGLLKNQNALPGSRTCVLNEHGTLILSSDPVSPAENYFLQTLDRKRPASSTAAIEKERAIIVIEELPDPGWTLVNISYLGNINLHEQVFTFSVIVILVLCFCIAVSMEIGRAHV